MFPPDSRRDRSRARVATRRTPGAVPQPKPQVTTPATRGLGPSLERRRPRSYRYPGPPPYNQPTPYPSATSPYRYGPGVPLARASQYPSAASPYAYGTGPGLTLPPGAYGSEASGGLGAPSLGAAALAQIAPLGTAGPTPGQYVPSTVQGLEGVTTNEPHEFGTITVRYNNGNYGVATNWGEMWFFDAYNNRVPHAGFTTVGQSPGGPNAPPPPGAGGVPTPPPTAPNTFYSATGPQPFLNVPTQFLGYLTPNERQAFGSQLQAGGFRAQGNVGQYGEQTYLRPTAPPNPNDELSTIIDPALRSWLRWFMGLMGYGQSYTAPSVTAGLPPVPPAAP